MNISQVYDNTINVLVASVNLETATELGEVFRDIVLKHNGTHVQNGLRVARIDTLEIRPSRKKGQYALIRVQPRSQKSCYRREGHYEAVVRNQQVATHAHRY